MAAGGRFGLFGAATFALALATPALACGGADAPCTTALGSYHVRLPDGAAGATPAFVYFHGAGGSGATIFGAEFADVLVGQGYAVIAPNGLERPDSRFGPGWFFRPESPGLRDEYAFTLELLADAAARHGIDRGRVVLTGYSIGSSLVWYLACRDHDLAAAYAPYAGGFWRPHPVDCDGPVRLLHSHGWRDQTVPLEGRPLRSGVQQGDIFEGLQPGGRRTAATSCGRIASRPRAVTGFPAGRLARRGRRSSWRFGRAGT